MDAFTHAVRALLNLLIELGSLILAGILAIELWLRAQLTLLGLPPAVQTVLLIALAVVLILAALRLFGGLIRVAVVLLLLLVVVRAVQPILPH